MMKEKIELLQVTKDDPSSDYVVITESQVFTDYVYVVSSESYQLLQEMFGDVEDSEEAFVEDPREWLVQLFDEDDFETFEQKVVEYYGGLQKAISFMSVGTLLRAASFEETRSRPILTEEEKNDKDLDENIIGDLFTLDTEVLDGTDDQTSVTSVIDYLMGLNKTDLKIAFLKLFSGRISQMDERLIHLFFISMLDGFKMANEEIPESVEELLGEIMNLFLGTLK